MYGGRGVDMAMGVWIRKILVRHKEEGWRRCRDGEPSARWL